MARGGWAGPGWVRFSVLAGVVWSLQAFATVAHASVDPEACSALARPNAFPHTTVSAARIVPADPSRRLPAFCEVVASVKPVPGSDIGVVYRLPESWNGKMLGLGGGGWAGNTLLTTAAPGLEAGYATAQTNGGHEVSNVWDTAWASNPAAATDFAYRAVHEMTVLGKAVVASYYGRPHKRAYFHGCSTGGRQALMEVQRFPRDYDGVIAGAPVYTLTTQTMSVVRNQIFSRPGASLSEAQLQALNAAVLEACDAQDGLADGVVTDPRACQFDPGTLQCKAGKSDGSCLTAAQVQAVRDVYAGVKNSSGETVAYPLTRGSELGWVRYISTGGPPTWEQWLTGAAGAGLGGLRALVFNDPGFDLAKFDPDRDYRTVRHSAFANEYEAKDADLSAFIQSGGKLLLWHGFDDFGPSALGTIEYYEQVQRTTGPKVPSLESSVRLFVLPGVYHCRGGPGADAFDAVAAIDRWVEHSEPPVRVIATRTDGKLSRPLCAWPTLPRYKGSGDPSSADSFECR
jgi:feruloyl esterase